MSKYRGHDERGYWQTWTARYYHDGTWWTINFTAYGQADAEARLRKMPLAQVDGTLEAVIPAFPGFGLLVRLWCAMRMGLRP